MRSNFFLLSLIASGTGTWGGVVFKQQFIGHPTPLDVPRLQLVSTEFPCLLIIPIAFKCLEIVDLSTFNDSASSSCVLLKSLSTKASTSSSLIVFGWPRRPLSPV
ncbi:hypothetical protein AVEN_109118-1 [Araneus ventricosus]|uniref:Uncharacterized protein n=1 Tax=Araneus ventricosus TaxID=182803 RepID=A0A4Y2QF71_ARAVE|nr:hypothetical protein AVEN_109118-1 [Araneus ventricosus]